MKVTFNGWQVVTIIGLVLTAIVVLVALGQELSALITTCILVASALGVPIVQGFVNSEKMNQNNALANGNLAALREQLNQVITQHSTERTEIQAQLQAANDRAVQLAAMISPDAKFPEAPHG